MAPPGRPPAGADDQRSRAASFRRSGRRHTAIPASADPGYRSAGARCRPSLRGGQQAQVGSNPEVWKATSANCCWPRCPGLDAAAMVHLHTSAAGHGPRPQRRERHDSHDAVLPAPPRHLDGGLFRVHRLAHGGRTRPPRRTRTREGQCTDAGSQHVSADSDGPRAGRTAPGRLTGGFPHRRSAPPPHRGGPHPTGAPGISTVDSLQDVLGLDFSMAASELADARLQQRCKDTPDNRAAVAAARARIDALLDMYLAAGYLPG